MATIKFHESAKQNFDDKSNSLLLELKPILITEVLPEFTPEFIPSAVIRDSDIIGRAIFKSGNETKYFIKSDKQKVGLSGEAYRQFKYLVDHLFRNPVCRERVSSNTIETHIFNWMEERYFGTYNFNLTEYLTTKLELLIKLRTVYVPVAATAIESEFRVGKVGWRH